MVLCVGVGDNAIYKRATTCGAQQFTIIMVANQQKQRKKQKKTKKKKFLWRYSLVVFG